MLPYTVLLRTVPILVILTMLSAATRLSHVYLLAYFRQTSHDCNFCIIPATLFISAVCAFWKFYVGTVIQNPLGVKLSGKLYYLFI